MPIREEMRKYVIEAMDKLSRAIDNLDVDDEGQEELAYDLEEIFAELQFASSTIKHWRK